MLTAFAARPGGPTRRSVRDRSELTDAVMWLDMASPTEQERTWVREAYGHQVQFLEDLTEIEASARFFRDAHGEHLRLYFLQSDERSARNVDVGFTLNDKRLYSLHAGEVTVLRSFHAHAQALVQLPSDPAAILMAIDALSIAALADTFERLHTELETLSGAIFSGVDRHMQRVLQSLGRIEDVNGKARLGMIENRRALAAFGAHRTNSTHAIEIQDIVRDVDSLMTHSEYLFQKIDFLMDSALGMIDIRHARRLGIFTVLSVVLMPPTLIASIYGMNFRHMPELEWILGYPLALALMIAVAIGPLLYLWRKDWL